MIRTIGEVLEWDANGSRILEINLDHEISGLERGKSYRVELLDEKIVFMGRLLKDRMTIIQE